MRYLHAVLALGVVMSSATLFFLGWVHVWFQLAGSVAGRGDHAVASGLYDAALGLMMLGAAAAVLSRAPRWVWWWAVTGAVVFAVASANAHVHAADADLDAAFGGETWWSGVETALRMPWVWLVPAALLVAVVLRARTNDRFSGKRDDS